MKKYLLIFTLAGISPAFAHAFLKASVPAVGAVVASAPKALALTFTENLEAPFCTVTVSDNAGKQVNNGKPQAVPGHPDELSVPVTITRPGKYKVSWHALSVDTHKTQGDYSFTVQP